MSDFHPTATEFELVISRTFEISQIKKNRRLTCTTAVNIQLHGFCDCSGRTYRARLYLRSTD
jgi:hypothetical protein